MRILVDVRHLKSNEITGVGHYTIELLRTLFRVAPEHTYVLLTSCAGEAPKRVISLAKEAKYAEHVHLPIPNKRLNLELFFGIGKTLDERAGGEFDLVFLPNLNIIRLSQTLPYVLTAHDASWKLFPEFFSRRMRLWHAACRPQKLMQEATAIITPSESTKEDVVRLFHVPTDKIYAIPHGISKKSSDPHPQQPIPNPYVLFVGTREPRKNLPGIVEAVRRYREDTHSDIRLVVAGGQGWWDRQPIEQLLATHKEWIDVRGYVSDEEREALYHHARVLLWPSIYEGFGLPVLEAMQSGCPVITSTSSSLPELTGNAALLVNPFDAGEMIEALRAALDNHTLRTRLIQAGKTRAELFSWEETARKTSHVFNESISSLK